ncbi:unnamed protein product [Rotaria sordida]|uniref:Thioredoxin domain-containing protein n=1 Tax=Rotaria sordida TaxID=392033 RepID=A0A814KZY8_9BILA|nr:unnamed protein product [Rotaria sordida]
MAFRLTMHHSSFPELQSVKEVIEKIQEKKLVLILFNKKYSDAHDVEHKFNSWRNIYEKNYDLHVYKCVITPKSELKTEYKIIKAPTFIFFRHGEEIDRLEDINKVDPNESSSSENAEEKLRSWLDHCCTSN